MDIDSDNESSYSGSVSSRMYTGSETSSATTYTLNSSMRSGSPVPSVIPIDEDMLANAYRKEHGRSINNYSDVYSLPADEEELDRMGMYDSDSTKYTHSPIQEKQHALFVHIMGGKYTPAMSAVLADDVPGEVKTCLDLGCGNGSWYVTLCIYSTHCPTPDILRIIDVAHDFPHCQAVAIDLIPMQVP